ncbi:MAG: DMT family transporter [Candidatus Doudnabacteria bacterium]|nr:DMT family transporter [Candidatus Doudnabacteria bacterium]
MTWLYFAISAYFLLALTGVVDKFLVSKVVRHPAAYAFYIGITGPISLLLAPFGLKMLSISDFYVAAIAGVCFVIGIYYYFTAVSLSSVSRILPIFGGLIPLFTLIFAYVGLHERLNSGQYWAFAFLVSGAILVAYKKEAGGLQGRALGYAALSAALMALTAVFSKHIFEVSNFVSGMVWTRMSFLPVALLFLLTPQNRRRIFNAPKQAKPRNIFIYYASRFSGNVAGFMQNYAVSLGSVTVVNALAGTQFMFLLGLTTFLSYYFPAVLKEEVTSHILVQKIAAILLISGGLVLLTV